MEKKLTQERLKKVLRYSPDTGIFIRKSKTNSNQILNQKVGTVDNKYLMIMIDRKVYGAHRLAWLYMEGYLPEFEVDHKDRNSLNNKWGNLRHVTHACNMKNKSKYSNNISGVTGVSWTEQDKRWIAQIQVNKIKIYIGSFINFDDAVMARWNAEVEHNFLRCNTTSSAYNYLKGVNKVE